MAETICGPWLAYLLGTPFFRIQAILQTQDLIPGLKFNPTKGVFDGFKRIAKEEGVRSFYRSGLPYVIYAFARNFFEAACLPNSEQYLEIEEVEISSLDDTPIKSDSAQENNNNTNKFGLGDEQEKSTNIFTPKGFDELEKEEEMKKLKIQRENAENMETITTTTITKFTNDDEEEENPLSYPGLPLSIFILAWNTLIHPLEVLRVRVATDFGDKTKRRYRGMFNAAGSLVKNGGIRSLYKGYLPLTTFALVQHNMFGLIADKGQKTPFDIGVWFLSDIILYPLMVVGRRMMMTPDNPVGRYNTMMECFRGTYQQFGMKGFYKGFQITMLYYGVALGLFATIYNFMEEQERQAIRESRDF